MIFPSCHRSAMSIIWLSMSVVVVVFVCYEGIECLQYKGVFSVRVLISLVTKDRCHSKAGSNLDSEPHGSY